MDTLGNAALNTLLLLGLAVLSAFSVFSEASARSVESFKVGNWNGQAFTDDTSGQFSSCVATANYRSGISMSVQVDGQYNWAIGFSAPHWNMTPGSTITLQYRIDRGAWQQGNAKAENKTLARLPMPADGYIITRFRRGRTMYVYDGAYNYEFRLTGTSRLMQRLARCVQVHSVRYGAGLGQSTQPAPQTPAPASPNVAQLQVEATQALFNLMGQAGLSGLMLIPEGQREEDYKGLHAVAGNDARKIVAHIFEAGTYTSVKALTGLIIADSAEKCDGSFTSGSEDILESGKELTTSYATCQIGDETLVERAVIVPRQAGGIFIYGVADNYFIGGPGLPEVAPSELTDPELYAAAAKAAN